MDLMTNEVPDDAMMPADHKPEGDGTGSPETESERALVKKVQGEVRADKDFHKKAFEQMRRDMFVARNGYDPKVYPGKTSYVANIAGRHVKQKTAALYAKNPKATAKRRETLDFAVWDEDPKSLELAMQAIQLAQQQQAQAQAAQMAAQEEAAIVAEATGFPGAVDPMMGHNGGPALELPAELQQALATAQETMEDFQQGMNRRKEIKRLGRTLEILYSQSMREQKPLDFKTSMKKLVRRTCTTAVGYIELGFQREYGPRPEMTEKLADSRARLDHLRRLAEDNAEPDVNLDDPEIAELELAIQALQSEEEVILREGLIFDFPQSTKVIPDRYTKSLVGFVGARRITLEYMYTPDEVKEQFGKDLKKSYTGYGPNGVVPDSANSPNFVKDDDETEYGPREDRGKGLVCVWKTYDKPSGLVYLTADGYDGWLKEPAAPDVFVEDFWPVYALTFNDVEDEDSLFPPSDVALLDSQVHEINRSRQGKREHRKAARPRWVGSRGALQEADIDTLKNAEPFTISLLDMDPSMKLGDILQAIPVPGVDPNIYDTNEVMMDVQMVVGSQQAQMGGLSKATATESAISAGASATTDGSSIDDLDAFLTVIARGSGQILLREMSAEKVMEIVGPGAFWPHQTLAEIADEVYLEVEAGSTGKPNQAVEMQNWEKMLPFLIQMPGISPVWIARETIRRLDDNADLTEALTEGMPSLMAQNAMATAATALQPATGDPATDPASQGGQGANNAPAPPGGEGGSDPAFGSNQV